MRNPLDTRKEKFVAGVVAVAGLAMTAVGGSQAGWVSDATLRTPIQTSTLAMLVDGSETATVVPANESSFTGGLAPGQYASAEFLPSVMSSDPTSMLVDIDLVVSGVPTAAPGLQYAILPGDIAAAEYDDYAFAFKPLVDGAVNDWFLGSDAFTNVTPADFATTVDGAGGNLKVVFKADGDLPQGATFDAAFKFVVTEVANA